MVNPKRVYIVKPGAPGKGPVVYLMGRDQRADDNWALLYAIQLAKESGSQAEVLFCLVPGFSGAGLRQYGFMLRGLEKVALRLHSLGIRFNLLKGDPVTIVPKFLDERKASGLVMDFDPLRGRQQWKERIATKIDIPFHEVDAHNIVPCRVASSKQAFGAYTLRPSVKRLIPEFLDEYPALVPAGNHIPGALAFQADGVLHELKPDPGVPEQNWLIPGEKEAMRQLEKFIEEKLDRYAADKNDPNLRATSGLSAYLHFGQLSAQRVALEIVKRVPASLSTAGFLEELIVRRELADNYCFYNPCYDSFEGFPDWAKKTLNQHRTDERSYAYCRDQFEQAATHDRLWNAAQNQMVKTGYMHGYMRMYWAKKILEWSASPEEALGTAIYLNDRYQLDGRDPNGYTGCAWSIGGVHDRAWSERPVYGKIRYMNDKGAARKFDVKKYVDQWKG